MKKKIFFAKIKALLSGIINSFVIVFKSLFFGQKSVMNIYQEEALQSPLKTAYSKFKKNKVAMVGVVGFVSVFLFIFIGSIFIKADVFYVNKTQANMSPGFSLLSVPSDLKKNGILDMATASSYSMGIDNQNNVYIWGIDSDEIVESFPKGAAAPTDLKTAEESIKGLKATRVWAGTTHFLLELMDGSLVSYGLRTDTLSFGLTAIPTALTGPGIIGSVNVEQKLIQDGGLKTAVLGNQITLIITNANNLYMWGNLNNYPYNLNAAKGTKQVADVALGRSNLSLLFEDGTVKVLGQGPINDINVIPTLTNVKRLVTTNGSGIALHEDGTLTVWGDNQSKELDFDQRIQGKVVSLGKSVIGSDNFQHIVALLEDGTVYSWGSPTYGAIDTPNKLEKPSNVDKVYSGFYQNFAVDENGKLIDSWGLRGHLFGTDEYGRDLFARVINGGRISLTIGLIAVVISTTIGIIVGGVAGFYGGKVDIIMMRITEIVGSIPFFPLALTLSAILNSSRADFNTVERMVMIMVILGILSWTGLAALIRAQILAEREKEFVVAAKALGVKSFGIIIRHILPNVITVVIISATLGYAGSLLTEAGLSFLGFGVQLPYPSWGNLLTGAQEMSVIKTFWWRWIFPSIFLVITTISINIMGDGLRDAVDPRSSER